MPKRANKLAFSMALTYVIAVIIFEVLCDFLLRRYVSQADLRDSIDLIVDICLMVLTGILLFLVFRRLLLQRGLEVNRRNEAEATVSKREAQLNFALETSHIGAWELDLRNHSATHTSIHAEIFGYDSPPPGWNLEKFIGHVLPEARDEVKQIIQDGLITHTDWSFECPIRRADGQVRWIFVSGGYERNSNGDATRASGIVQDITPRKLMELALQEREEQLLLFAEHSPAAVAMLTRDLKYLVVSRRWMVDFRLGDQPVVGRSHCEIFPELPARWLEVYQRCLAGAIETCDEDQFPRKDGTIGWVRWEVRPWYETKDSIGGIIIFCENITVRKKAEAALRESEENFRAMFEVASIGIAQINPVTRKWLRVNPKMCEITGYKASELIQLKVSDLTHVDDRQRDEELYQSILRGELPDYHLEKRYVRNDSAIVWVNVNMTAIRDVAGELVHAMATIEDITARKQLEAQYQQAQKMEAIGQLAGGVAHDFNNILTSILLQVEISSHNPDLPPGILEGFLQIRKDAERAASLTRQLLLFSRRQVMKSYAVNLNDSVTSLAKMLQRIIGEDVRLQLMLPAEPLRIHADPGMLDQVLMNLAVNARDAMPQGGQVTIKIAEETVTETAAQNYPGGAPGHYACLSVTDTGCGIPPEVLPRIFEPFFTTKEPGKGTGLGLATVFGIVKQHKGWLAVDSQPGCGTTFTVYLPMTKTAGQEPVAVTSTKPAGGTETLLLVEDEVMVRKNMLTMLTRFGYQVFHAANGQDALKVWADHREKISLLITDVVMPAGLSGQQLARQLSADNAKLKTIFISGYNAEMAGREIQLQRNERFVQKPFSADELLKTVRTCLDE